MGLNIFFSHLAFIHIILFINFFRYLFHWTTILILKVGPFDLSLGVNRIWPACVSGWGWQRWTFELFHTTKHYIYSYHFLWLMVSGCEYGEGSEEVGGGQAQHWGQVSKVWSGAQACDSWKGQVILPHTTKKGSLAFGFKYPCRMNLFLHRW